MQRFDKNYIAIGQIKRISIFWDAFAIEKLINLRTLIHVHLILAILLSTFRLTCVKGGQRSHVKQHSVIFDHFKWLMVKVGEKPTT